MTAISVRMTNAYVRVRSVSFGGASGDAWAMARSIESTRPEKRPGLPEVSSFFPAATAASSAAIDGRMIGVYSLLGAVLLSWILYLVWAIAEPHIRRAGESQPAAATFRVAAIVTGVVAVFETTMVVWVAVPIWKRRTPVPPSSANAVTVRVVAEQYAWHFHYPGTDGQFGVSRPSLVSADNPIGLDRTSANGADDIVVSGDLHVPVGRQVVAQLTSRDAVHSFGVMELRVKQDVVPGAVGTVWFTSSVAGRFTIACSQLCGPGHDQMRGNVVVESAADFDAFLAQHRVRVP